MDSFDRFCPSLANSIQEALNSEWISARIDAVFYPETSHYYGEYVPQVGASPRGFGPTLEAQEILRDMRDACHASGQPVWGQATFTLWLSGKFSLTFGYANCDENGDTRFNEEEFLEFKRQRFDRLTR